MLACSAEVNSALPVRWVRVKKAVALFFFRHPFSADKKKSATAVRVSGRQCALAWADVRKQKAQLPFSGCCAVRWGAVCDLSDRFYSVDLFACVIILFRFFRLLLFNSVYVFQVK